MNGVAVPLFSFVVLMWISIGGFYTSAIVTFTSESVLHKQGLTTISTVMVGEGF